MTRIRAFRRLPPRDALPRARATDLGSPSPYRENPATNGHPVFKSLTQGMLPSIYPPRNPTRCA